MEEICDVSLEHPARTQAAEEVDLLLFIRTKKANVGRRALREKLPELAELQEARVGIVAEEALGCRCERHQLRVMRGEEGEVWRAG